MERSEHFALAVRPTFPIVNFCVKSDGLDARQVATIHAEIVDDVTRDGQRWISDTVVNGASVLRMMVISYLNEERHLRALEGALQVAGRRITSTESSINIRK